MYVHVCDKCWVFTLRLPEKCGYCGGQKFRYENIEEFDNENT